MATNIQTGRDLAPLGEIEREAPERGKEEKDATVWTLEAMRRT